MREFKFRAKTKNIEINDDRWVYGFYYDTYCNGKKVSAIIEDFYLPPTSTKDAIPSSRTIEAKKETVGQYTGLRDKNGKEIYEGDILQDNQGNKQIVEWDTFCDSDGYVSSGFVFRKLIAFGDTTEIEVIGNIYENKEMIEQ